MATQKLVVFKHDSALGNYPAHKLFERVKISRKDDTKPARDISDYQIEIDENKMPQGVKVDIKL
jgi:CRISPR-associated protein Csd2